MCICFFTFGSVKGRPLLVTAFNRDEYVQRATEPLHVWLEDHPTVLAGRDCEAGGTWLGISTTGRVAFLTNLRASDPVEPASVNPAHLHRSRGDLPVEFLTTTVSPSCYVKGLHGQAFHGFNLVLGDLVTGEFVYTNNGEGKVDLVPQELSPGRVYGLSNGKLDEWPKVQSGVALMQELLDGQPQACGSGRCAVPWDALMKQLLGSNVREMQPAPPEPHDFVRDLDYLTSARFVDLMDSPYGPYGTRSQTVAAVWPDGHAEVRDRYMGQDGQWSVQGFDFYMRAKAG